MRNKRRCIVLISFIFCLVLNGCEPSNKSKVETVTKKYVKAMEENDLEEQYECYNPNLQTASKGFTDGIANQFGVSNGYDTGLAAGSLFGSALQDASGVHIKLDYKGIEEMDLQEDEGQADLRYSLNLDYEGFGNIEGDIIFSFKVSQHDKNWYIDAEPDSNFVDTISYTDENGNEKTVTAEELGL